MAAETAVAAEEARGEEEMDRACMAEEAWAVAGTEVEAMAWVEVVVMEVAAWVGVAWAKAAMVAQGSPGTRVDVHQRESCGRPCR